MSDAAGHWEPETAGGPSIATLLDPVALEARLVEARVRRARALAARGAPPALPHAVAAARSLRFAKPGFLAGIAIGALAVALVGIAIPWRAGGPWIGGAAPTVALTAPEPLRAPASTIPLKVSLREIASPQVGAEPMLLTPAPDLLTLPAHEVLSVSKARSGVAAAAWLELALPRNLPASLGPMFRSAGNAYQPWAGNAATGPITAPGPVASPQPPAQPPRSDVPTGPTRPAAPPSPKAESPRAPGVASSHSRTSGAPGRSGLAPGHIVSEAGARGSSGKGNAHGQSRGSSGKGGGSGGKGGSGSGKGGGGGKGRH